MVTNTPSQFMRIESFARVPSKKKKRSGHKPAAGIVGEVLREAAFSKHVANPLRPTILYGSPMDTLHKALNMADTARDARGHQLRKDAHILAGCVCSYPVSVTEIVRDQREQSRLSAWVQKVCRWALQEFWRQNVGAIVLHMDESHPHLHILITPPEPGMEPSPLRRAGKQALRLADTPALRREGKKNPKRHALERKAYCDEAMRLQNSFYHSVSRSSAHRISPKGRRRLTRAEWLYPWNVRARTQANAPTSPALSANHAELPCSPAAPRDIRPALRGVPAPHHTFKAAEVQRHPDSAANRSTAPSGGLHPALRVPLNSQHRNATSSLTNLLQASRQAEARPQLGTNAVSGPSSRSAPARRAKSWRGNGAAGNQAHTRALAALKQSATTAKAITGTAPDVAENFQVDDLPNRGM